jgi:hypothetical protein
MKGSLVVDDEARVADLPLHNARLAARIDCRTAKIA